MNSNEQPQVESVEEVSFENLQPLQDLTNSGNLIQTYIKGHSWSFSYNCITELRKINKYHPEFIPDIIDRYSNTILELLNTGKTLLIKNILKLIKQLFDAGQQINVQKAVYAFLPILIKKASTDIGHMKTVSQEVLTSFSSNCGYEASFVIASQQSCDKNVAIAELSIKLLAALLQKIGAGIMQLSENTLATLMRGLMFNVDGKRQNLRTQALDICIFICEAISSANYLQLMQFCLKQDEVKTMGVSMENHRQNKPKPLQLKEALKERQTENFNMDFFNSASNHDDIKQGNQNHNNQNYSNQNYNYQNYNQGYNQGYSQNYY